MNKFDGILFCTDLDGTLLKNDKTISKENLDAIEYFKSEGGYFTFITGRLPYFSEKFYQIIHPNAPIGCINGGGVYDYETKKYLHAITLPPSVIELVEYVDRAIPNIGIQLNTLERIYFSNHNQANVDFCRWTDVEDLNLDYHKVTEPIAKIVFADNDINNIHRLAELLDSHPRAAEFDFVHSERTLYEILPKGVHKGAALAPIAQSLGVDRSRTVVVGDYNNDIGMVKEAALGYAVANATDEVKAVADRITVSNEEHAIARIIQELERDA
ncbi:MAG: HAD family phosphatase [Clostridia bacterium]|nr:HAD family phosphatase [Clostridia bacterium]